MDFPPVFAKRNLVLAGVPVGNTGDASPRLCQALSQAEIIACEDTRRLRDLTRRLGVETSARLVAYHEHNETETTEQLIQAAAAGQRVLLVSDAGMPGISDPGFRLSREAAMQKVPFTVIPGPSAPLLALLHSGLPTDCFTFMGFLPRKAEALEQSLQKISSRTETLIFFESPRRIHVTVAAMCRVLGVNRHVALVREITKIHEESWRGTLGEVSQRLAERGEVRGEIVIVIEGAPRLNTTSAAVIDAEHLEKFDQLVQKGLGTKDVAKLLSQWFGLPRKALYDAYVAQK